MKKKGMVVHALLLFSLFFASILFHPESIHAQIESDTVGVHQDWILDETNGYIYFLSSDKNELVFIQMDDLKIIDRIDIGANAVDLEQYKDKLYLAYLDKQLKVVDLTSRKIDATFNTSKTPIDIAVEQGKVFYIAKEFGWNLFEFNLSTKTDENVKTENRTPIFSEPSIEIDPVHHILYIGESGVTGSDIFAIDTLNYKIKSQSTFDDGYGFYFPKSKIVIDGERVYYAGRSFDSNNLAIIHGDYSSTVNFAKDQYVFTEKGLFQRDTFQSTSLITNGSILMDSSHNLYTYDPGHRTIKKSSFNVSFEETTRSTKSEGKLRVYAELSDWVYDETSDMIYAVSMVKNKLYYINAATLEIVHELSIGSKPIDVELHNDKIFIALWGATKVAVTSTSYDGKVQELVVTTNPYRIAVSDQIVFYTGEDQHEKVYGYDMRTGFNSVLHPSVYEPSLLVDHENNLLYIAESGSSGSSVFILDINDFSILQKDDYKDGYGFPYLARYLSKEGDSLHAGSWKLNRNNVTEVLGNFGESIIYVNHGFAFSHEKVYDSKNQALLGDLPFHISLAAVDQNGRTLAYNKQDQTIYQYHSIYDLIPLQLDQYLEKVKFPDQLLSYYPLDIDDHWAYDQLDDFVNADLLKGYVDPEGYTNLKPNQSITRAEFVTILVRALGLKSSDQAKSFQDVKKSDWFYGPVSTASSLGIVGGSSNGYFEPNRNIQRDEMAAIIVRAFEKSITFNGDVKTFRDVPEYWATQVIKKASSAGIIGGVTPTEFKPFAEARRAEAVVMLHRALHSETSDLPSDEELKKIVLDLETKMMEAQETIGIKDEERLIHQYTTGYQHEMMLFNNEMKKTLNENGIEMNVRFIGDLTAFVIDKTNRFAAVELKGATYDIQYKRGNFYSNDTQNTSGTAFLKKMPEDGTWKIYQIYMPHLYD